MYENQTYKKLEKRIQELENVKSEWEQSKEKLNHEKKIYRFLIDISSQHISIPYDAVENAINISLKEIGKFVSADRAYVFKYDFKNNIGINTYEWCAKGIEPQIDNLQESPIDVFADWVKSHHNGEPVIINAVAELALTPMRRILEKQQIKSLVSVPMFQDNKLVGFSGFDAVRKPHIFSTDEIEVIKSFIKITTILKKRKTKDEKQILPFSDSINFRDYNFTPSEIQIINLIKNGKNSKEIAQLLNISLRTVGTHRTNIRKKLNISNKKINLMSYLLSINR